MSGKLFVVPTKFALLFVSLLVVHVARADAPTCDGPPACCPAKLVDSLPEKVKVAVGVAFRGLYNVDEKMGTWDTDYYLYEAWKATPGFFPQTEIINEISRQSSQFDETTILRDGRCFRSRRIHSTLHNSYDLKRFPFDRQALKLEIGDAEFDSTQVEYDAVPLHLGLDARAREELAAWHVRSDPSFTLTQRVFSWDQKSPTYAEADVTVSVRRQVAFYLTRFFVPLLLIVAIAFTVFWIHPEDLGSQTGIGVTCLLAVIAFQFAQASSLPVVAYLTFADRVYAICYFAIALALIESIYCNKLVRRGNHAMADRIDHISRWLFPLTTSAMVAIGFMLSA